MKNLEHVVVVESRDDRCDRDAGRNAGLGDRLQRRQPSGDGRRLRLHFPGHQIGGEGDAQEHANRSFFVEPPKQIEITQDQRGLRDNGDRVAKLGADLEARAGQAQGRLHRLIAIGDAREDNELARP